MTQETPDPREAAYAAAVNSLAGYATEPYGDLRLNAERAAAKAVTAAMLALDLPSRDARVRAETAEQIARSIEGLCPTPGEVHAGDHCDFADAAAVAREYAVRPAERPSDATAEPVGTPTHPAVECELGVAGDWCALPIGHDGPCTATRRIQPRPILTNDTRETPHGT